MEQERNAQDGVVITPSEVRARRLALGKSQRELGAKAGRGLSTIQDYELDRRVSLKSAALIERALEALEVEAAQPPTAMVEVPESELRAVLDEIRALRRLHEDTRDRLEALQARIESPL